MIQPALFSTECHHPVIRQLDSKTARCADCGAWVSSGHVAEQRRREGIAQVMANEDEEWKTLALACVYRVARRAETFTVEDLRDEWLRDGIGNPHHANVIGALFHTIKSERIALPTDRTTKATHVDGHGRAVRVWRSCLC